MAKRKKASRKRTSKAARKTGKKVAARKVKKAAKRRPPKKAARKTARKAAKKVAKKRSVKKAARKKVIKKKAARKKVTRRVAKKKVARKAAKKVAKRKAVKKAAKKPAMKRAVKRAVRPPLAKPSFPPPAPTEEPVSGFAPVVDVELPRPPSIVGPAGQVAEERGPTLYEPDEPREAPSAEDDELFDEGDRSAPTLFNLGAGPAPAAVPAAGGERELTVGRPAPDFALPDARGQMHTLASHRGRKVVLYFYPKDDTPGCAREACGFRDRLAAFEERNVAVLGVSPDPAASHAAFTQKYGLTFPLLSDEGHAVAERYGVSVASRTPDGQTKRALERTTFVIDESGNVAHVFRQVQPDGHEEEVLDWLDRERATDVWR